MQYLKQQQILILMHDILKYKIDVGAVALSNGLFCKTYNSDTLSCKKSIYTCDKKMYNKNESIT